MNIRQKKQEVRTKTETMKIINVLEIRNGVLSSVESFPIMDIPDRLEHLGFWDEKEAVEQAEEMFLGKAVANGMKLREAGNALDNGTWDNGNGYEILIHWSAINVNE